MICVRSMNERCDQLVHCRDKSDENNCKLLVLEESYNKKVPPFNYNDTTDSVIPVSVKLSTILRNVLEISESTHTIHLKLGITLEWYENRALYHNLKNEEALNVLSDSEVKNILYFNVEDDNVSIGQFSMDPFHHLPEYRQ